MIEISSLFSLSFDTINYDTISIIHANGRIKGNKQNIRTNDRFTTKSTPSIITSDTKLLIDLLNPNTPPLRNHPQQTLRYVPDLVVIVQ